MYKLIRPLIFAALDGETAHRLTVLALGLTGDFPLTRYLLRLIFDGQHPGLATEAFGLQFKNPVGLAAGFDKGGRAGHGLSALGFGHAELGTVTPKPQAGNPRPRVWRFPAQAAVINYMGFPNPGVDAFRLQPGAYAGMQLGLNLGKGKDTPLDRAAEDYCALLTRLHPLADYFAINVSCPNVADLRRLQSREYLESLLTAIAATRDRLTPRRPLLLKISPDLTEPELDNTLAALTAAGFDGIIAVNTTTRREGLPPAAAQRPGGLSGQPLAARATAVIRYLARRTEGKLPIIGVGGIGNAADALDKIRAGAWLTQIYTGMIYSGPGLAGEINRGLYRACQQAGVQHLAELRGQTP